MRLAHFSAILPLATVIAICLGACAEGADDDGPVRSVPIWRLAPEPDAQIGVVEGDPNYELHQANSSILLPGNRIAVADAGSQELRFYDFDGRFISKAGGRGAGPGEFRWLSRIYRYEADSILALEAGSNRISVFDTHGTYSRLASAISLSGDSAFPMDVWLFRQFWIDGALHSERRAAVRRALASVSVSDTVLAYRFVRVDDSGSLWIREPLDEVAQRWRWTVTDPRGLPKAIIETPLRFAPHQIGDGFVLGRWRDENDVNFIHMYRVETTDAIGHVPEWLANPADMPIDLASDEEEELIAKLRSSLRQVVLAQESYFAGHGGYTENRHLLTWMPPEGVALDIITAGPTGWAAVATDRRLKKICGMAVGSGTPPGWPEGMARCG
jgi:hypothetical protein